MSTREKFSLITVNYNSSKQVTKLIKSIANIKDYLGEIIIIDNNSNPRNKKILSKLKGAKIIWNDQNLGFSKAVNQGIDCSKLKITLIINPDCIFFNNSPINTFKLILNNNRIGIAGGRIINSFSGKYQFTATKKPNFLTGLFEFTNLKKFFPNNIFSKRFWIETNTNLKQPRIVHSLCGAYLFLRKESAIKFDESFFLYLEDLELGHTVIKNKMETWYDPRSAIKHESGSSSNSIYRIVLRHWYLSRKIYFLKHLSILEGFFIYIIFSLEEKLLSIYHSINNKPNE